MILKKYIVTMRMKDVTNVTMEPLKQEMYSLTNVFPVMNIRIINVTWWTIILQVPAVLTATLSAQHLPQITSIPAWDVML